jgi:hypothetical protein
VRRRIMALAVLSVALVSLAGCSSASADAKNEAKAACAASTPALSGQTTTTTFGQALSDYQAAQKHSAKAAAEDPQWNVLNEAYGTMISAWAAKVAVTGRNVTSEPQDSYAQSLLQPVDAQWDGSAAQAETTIRSECAVANS